MNTPKTLPAAHGARFAAVRRPDIGSIALFGREYIEDQLLEPLAEGKIVAFAKSSGLTPNDDAAKTTLKAMKMAVNKLADLPEVTEENVKNLANANYYRANIAGALAAGNPAQAMTYKRKMQQAYTALDLSADALEDDYIALRNAVNHIERQNGQKYLGGI